ncbi:outer membrane beta-barrel protein [Aurantiacibacter gangjinensis]|uniref:outer membrane beta-barrel protein n=1 Tax=Aurantiacibacter gangjinensis TaxID=502682 RepID=UPI000AEE68CA|nr:outer membrane beta-barrel protein [Aurantiacibacter gangjinensis]
MHKQVFTGVIGTLGLAIAMPVAAQDQADPFDGAHIGTTIGYHDIDGPADGFIIGARIGYDLPVGNDVVVGAEANANFGTGDIDAEYGTNVRIGTRFGERRNALLFARFGYQEVDFDLPDVIDDIDEVDTTSGDYMLGIGADFGINESSSTRLAIDTIGFDSIRFTAGYTIHF